MLCFVCLSNLHISSKLLCKYKLFKIICPWIWGGIREGNNKNINSFFQLRNGISFLLTEISYRLTPVAYMLACSAKNGSAFDRCGLRHTEAVTFMGIMYESLNHRMHLSDFLKVMESHPLCRSTCSLHKKPKYYCSELWEWPKNNT